MYRFAAILAGSCVLAVSLAGCSSQRWTSFGDATTMSRAATVDARDILAQKDAYDGHQVRVSGTIESVCASKGCWIRLGTEESDETIFVKFTCPVDDRLVPMEAVGHEAVVEGKLAVIQITEDVARHYKEDAGADPAEIAKIVGPQQEVTIQSPAARIEGLSTR